MSASPGPAVMHDGAAPGAMPAPRRNRLVWLADAAWARLAAQDGQDETGRAVLGHWRAQRLPLVVARPSLQLPAGRVALGLPAPERWQRRRLSLQAGLDEIERQGRFPSLADVVRAQGWDGEAAALADALAALGADARVYGSLGWELLSGERYLRAASDIDLSVEVRDFAHARAVLALLEPARLPRRLDGELVLADGSALAWRELGQLLAGRASQVLLKRADGVALAGLDELRRSADAAAAAA
ncbi:malonate decarboxylase holo-[acyl-carrier-protein] synthase [Caldimonas tepidiphila]|uniref:malonate decarboxylase holo-[acyl-carrier-protein] synthase n=1 Tax=Caldimonas tepidiphila TaxID=2315841 RepID=UPI000E5A18A9|nr:malonate decarboxylase holo-[acyl-carrier-protein] synthase [Caldimonas tepidiphila]